MPDSLRYRLSTDDDLGRSPHVPEGFWLCAALLSLPILLLAIFARLAS